MFFFKSDFSYPALFSLFMLCTSLSAAMVAKDTFATRNFTAGNEMGGLYSQSMDGSLSFAQSYNRNVSGGMVKGFAGDWLSNSSRFRPILPDAPEQSGGLLLIRSPGAAAARALENPIDGSVLYASANLQLDLEVVETLDSGNFLVGFSHQEGHSGVGAVVGYSWNAFTKRWDLVVRYNDGGGAVTAIIQSGVASSDSHHLLWRMDQSAQTLSIWVNPHNPTEPGKPTIELPNFRSSVEQISHLYLRGHLSDFKATQGNGFVLAEIRAATTLKKLF